MVRSACSSGVHLTSLPLSKSQSSGSSSATACFRGFRVPMGSTAKRSRIPAGFRPHRIATRCSSMSVHQPTCARRTNNNGNVEDAVIALLHTWTVRSICGKVRSYGGLGLQGHPCDPMSASHVVLYTVSRRPSPARFCPTKFKQPSANVIRLLQ
jgi:hypothetical protein